MSLPDPRKLTAQRIARTEAYAAKIQRMFSQTVNELLSLPLSKADAGSGQMYSFDAETERTQRKVEQLLRRLQAAATLAIQKGVTLEWEQANQAADAIIKSQFSKKALASSYMKGWNARNLEAMQQFLNRSDTGMNLSQRVWQSCRQLRDEMEVALTVSIGEGEDAGTISRRVRQYLNDPDLMFRRFRYKDEDGRWQTKWKKRIKDPDRPGKYRFIDYDKDSYKDQWTGKGYYKSSAKNAMRVARTETNIAYRRADHERWQGLDFVLGQRVVLSKNHPEVDICDKLSAPNQREYDADDKRGLYPKDFVFDGWHPQCFCFVIPVMVAPEEMAKMNEAFVKGEDYTPKGEQVTEYPDEFKGWVRDNATKIKEAQKRGTEPYFVRNNAEAVENIINPNPKKIDIKGIFEAADTPFEAILKIKDYDEILSCKQEIEKQAKEYGISTLPSVDKLTSITENTKDAWGKYASVKELVGKSLSDAYRDLQDTIKNIEKLKRLKDLNKAIPELESGIASMDDLSSLINAVNTRFKDADKWLHHGDIHIDFETQGNNGGNNLNGTITLSNRVMSRIQSGLTKAQMNQVENITHEEAEAIHTLWHEITHDRALKGSLSIKNTIAEPFMELANEYVARNTMSEFYEAIGIKSGIPHPGLMISRTTCGYEAYIRNYQTVLNKCRLDKDDVLAAVREHLFNEDYSTNKDGLIKGLRKGGIKLRSGEKVSDELLGELMDLIVKPNITEEKITDFLKSNDFRLPSRHRKKK